MMHAACLAVALVTLLSTPAWAEDPDESSAKAPAHAAWVGHWTLDEAKSDPIDKMLETMEVPWYVKPLARTFTPGFEMKAAGNGLDVYSSTPLGSRVQKLTGDGVEHPGKDALGRSFRETSHWQNGHLLVDRTTKLPSGTTAFVRSDWSLKNATLTNQMEIKIGDQPAFPYRRVFVRENS